MSRRMARLRILPIALCALFGAWVCQPARSAAGEVSVFAAASLKTALDEIAVRFERDTGYVVVASFAGSSALARQIQHGAPADIFISANTLWMDVLETDRLIDTTTRVDLLTNAIVLVAHGRAATPVKISPNLNLAEHLGENRLAMALVDAVPVGIYGKAALTSLSLWESVEAKVVQTDNARAALALVARGEAAMGIVYATDAVVSDNVTIVGRFTTGSHPPVVYPAATIAASNNPNKEAFLAYLRRAPAVDIFRQQGFAVVAE